MISRYTREEFLGLPEVIKDSGLSILTFFQTTLFAPWKSKEG